MNMSDLVYEYIYILCYYHEGERNAVSQGIPLKPLFDIMTSYHKLIFPFYYNNPNDPSNPNEQKNQNDDNADINYNKYYSNTPLEALFISTNKHQQEQSAKSDHPHGSHDQNHSHVNSIDPGSLSVNLPGSILDHAAVNTYNNQNSTNTLHTLFHNEGLLSSDPGYGGKGNRNNKSKTSIKNTSSGSYQRLD